MHEIYSSGNSKVRRFGEIEVSGNKRDVNRRKT